MNGELRRRLWALAWPAILANIGQTLVNIVDMIMVGQLGSLAIASVGLGGQFSWFLMPLMFAISTGTLALVARFVGARDFGMAERVLEQSVYLAFFMSIPVMLFGLFFGDDALKIMGASEDVIKLGYSYIRMFFLFYPVNFMAFAAFSALRGAGDTKTPMKLTLLTNGANVFLNYGLIFGNFGLPRLEVVGAALASGLSILIAFIVGLVLFLKGSLVLRFRPSFKPDWEVIKRILRIGIPATIERAIFSFYNFLYISIVTRFGTIALAAH
ncbi:MAG TPA: MATE family efflux transporter, partial [Thermococcus sp.]|nr:MATE family efflux transporter [Thermococcus sp.]